MWYTLLPFMQLCVAVVIVALHRYARAMRSGAGSGM